MITIVCDTNVLVSALLNPKSVSGQILRWVVESRIELALTPHLEDELRRVLAYPRIKKILARSWNDDDFSRFTNALVALASPVPDVEPEENWIERDPDDDWVIQCALTAAADMIVTGDDDLLILGVVMGIPILSPSAFVAGVSSPV